MAHLRKPQRNPQIFGAHPEKPKLSRKKARKFNGPAPETARRVSSFLEKNATAQFKLSAHKRALNRAAKKRCHARAKLGQFIGRYTGDAALISGLVSNNYLPPKEWHTRREIDDAVTRFLAATFPNI
jgi:hypothetical protein